MPKRNDESSAEDREYIYTPSSSSDEDWGNGSWEVDGIIGEHIDTRGERRLVAASITFEFILLSNR